MASRGRKKGKIVEDQPIEDNENMARRNRGGRTKKVIDYCESSPIPAARRNKGTEKTVVSTKLEKGVKQNTKTKTKPVNKKLKLETVDDKDQKDELTSVISKSNAHSKSKGKMKDGKDHVENKFEVPIIKDEQHTTESKVEKRSLEMSYRELTTPRGGKGNKQSSAQWDRKRKHELVKETDNQENESTKQKMVKDEGNDITELNTSGVTKNIKNRKKRGILSSKKQTKDSSRQPLSKRHDNVPIGVPNSRKKTILKDKNTESETVQKHKETDDIGEQCEEGMRKHYTETECKQEKHSPVNGRTKECPSKQTGNTENTEECPRKQTRNSESIDECDSKQMGNNTFTIDSTLESPVTTKDRTPRSTVRQNTPSSESRVKQVKENLRNSLCGNTPTNPAQADYSYQMSQVFEVLELVTEQLKDLKAEMATTKSTNESMKTKLESTQTDYTQMREEMNNLKNTVQQITTNTAQLEEAPKSSTNQGEIDILWEKCDTQKKMIRTLHDEVDNTRNDFNKKLEKYKKATIFIMCKTKPDIRQSDVSNLRHLLSKTEESLNSTFDEICSSMEADINMSTPSRRKSVVPKASHPILSKEDTSRRKPVVPKASHPVIPIEDTGRNEKIERGLIHNEYLGNGNISVSVDSTPTKGHDTLDPFRPRKTMKRTPVSKSSK